MTSKTGGGVENALRSDGRLHDSMEVIDRPEEDRRHVRQEKTRSFAAHLRLLSPRLPGLSATTEDFEHRLVTRLKQIEAAIFGLQATVA